jgi:hypothetical protein
LYGECAQGRSEGFCLVIGEFEVPFVVGLVVRQDRRKQVRAVKNEIDKPRKFASSLGKVASLQAREENQLPVSIIEGHNPRAVLAEGQNAVPGVLTDRSLFDDLERLIV